MIHFDISLQNIQFKLLISHKNLVVPEVGSITTDHQLSRTFGVSWFEVSLQSITCIGLLEVSPPQV